MAELKATHFENFEYNLHTEKVTVFCLQCCFDNTSSHISTIQPRYRIISLPTKVTSSPYPTPWQPLICFLSLKFHLFQSVMQMESCRMQPFELASFTQCNAFEIMQVACLLLFIAEQGCKNVTDFIIHQQKSIWISPQFLMIMNKVTINICIQAFF